MAGADYYSCDVCRGKTFYDANLDYDDDNNLAGVGDIAVICESCAKTHSVIIVEKDKV